MPKTHPARLTSRQAEILGFIASYLKAHGYSPTVREIGESCGITSPNGVVGHIRALEQKGVLRKAKRGGRGIARTLEVVGDAAMQDTAPDVEQIVSEVARRFRCFGVGGNVSSGSSIAVAMRGKPPTFSAGVDVGEVVRFVVSRVRA